MPGHAKIVSGHCFSERGAAYSVSVIVSLNSKLTS